MLFRGIIFSFFLFALQGCTERSAPDAPARVNLPEITAASEEGGFVDLGLAVESTEFDGAGNCRVRAMGTHNGKRVGLVVTFSSELKPGAVNGQITNGGFTKAGISYESIGPESDSLLEAMASLYRQPLLRHTFTKDTAVTAFALAGNPSRIKSEPLKFKVFFNDQEGQEGYAELYTNVDLPARTLQLFEKDPEYRGSVLNALAVDP